MGLYLKYLFLIVLLPLEQEDGKLPLLDTRIYMNEEGSTNVTVYRKPAHTDHYLDFSSYHHLYHKTSVVSTLFHRAEIILTEDRDKK